MNKHMLRQQVNSAYQNLSGNDRLKAEKKIYEYLFQWSGWKQAETIAVTVSLKNEINTGPIIETGWQQGKRMCVPKIEPEQRGMDFYEIQAFGELERTIGQIYEPKKNICPLVPPEQLDLVLVPGLVFNRQGYRIGFGGGYYDRFLKRADFSTAALIHPFQLQDRIPVEAHDVPVQTLISSQGLIHVE
ncbi:5-formyltetrahydrofolate cyclo-ligase [Marinococcus luteus]|uniref:5-formyltetrahydrofolate cyclo-ligase n=1 Tax=Marinococcus luteus TaxID=1122204 RepID=A0A1H2RXU1_9BACI|nr:5-formyltetrahydrofolate cyclo-ligase [Marinococcus luteus]SDW24301.1 5-formyltetrahydrofolate cyclo-ligase [Marinococcus luteus]